MSALLGGCGRNEDLPGKASSWLLPAAPAARALPSWPFWSKPDTREMGGVSGIYDPSFLADALRSKRLKGGPCSLLERTHHLECMISCSLMQPVHVQSEVGLHLRYIFLHTLVLTGSCCHCLRSLHRQTPRSACWWSCRNTLWMKPGKDRSLDCSCEWTLPLSQIFFWTGRQMKLGAF